MTWCLGRELVFRVTTQRNWQLFHCPECRRLLEPVKIDNCTERGHVVTLPRHKTPSSMAMKPTLPQVIAAGQALYDLLCEHMPDTYQQTDSRMVAWREITGDQE